MMEELLGPLSYWHWWIGAVILLVLELVAPGIFFLWLAIAAGLTGFLPLLLSDVSWQIQLLVFALLAVVSVYGGRRFWKRTIVTDHPNLNQRGANLVGKTYSLETAIENGSGRVKVGDGLWLVNGPDLPTGTKVRVVAVEGATLQVEAVDQGM